MKVKAYNSNPVIKAAYQCSICGLYRCWTDQHRYIERAVGSGYYGYEVVFITCSEECRAKQRQVFINWLSQFEGWSEKSAAQNFDLYIK